MTVTARINVETPAGRKIVRELEKHRKLVEIDYETPEFINGVPEGYITLEEGEKNFWDSLKNKMGYDVRVPKK